MLLDSEKNEVSVIPVYHNGKIVNTVGAGNAFFVLPSFLYVQFLLTKNLHIQEKTSIIKYKQVKTIKNANLRYLLCLWKNDRRILSVK